MADDAQKPITTIPPFADISKLPPCAAACGPLYDANGACVPPAFPQRADDTIYTSCFCADPRVTGFSFSSTSVCGPDACATDSAGLSSIAGWFRSLCSIDAAGVAPPNQQTSATAALTSITTSMPGSGGSKSGSKSNQGEGGDWLSNHWQWVIMLVILVVAIAGIWVGACIWRRRYLKKKDRQTSLGQKHSGSVAHPSWGPPVTGSTSAVGSNRGSGVQGVFMPGAPPPAVMDEKKAKRESKKWTVTERT